MTRALCAAAVVCALALSAVAANAKPRHQMPRNDSAPLAYCAADKTYRQSCGQPEKRIQSHVIASHGDPKPRAWCGWWLRHELNVADRAGNLARWWARYGANAHGPAVGAIVVWPHHVGLITGKTDAGWLVKSGNDGHAVRERERSLRGAIAFRWPNQWASR